jgi:hypothetical protein
MGIASRTILSGDWTFPSIGMYLLSHLLPVITSV